MKKEYTLGLLILLLIIFGLLTIFISPNKTTKVISSDSKTSYIEITNPAGFVNTNDQPIKIADYVGKKVILLDVMTYSCINCQRTFPYVTAWYNKYKDQGLIVIGIHTPEFAFEKDKNNVEEAMKRFGITFPVVLDNDYGTWNAYGNRYWPRKYLIDIHGNIAYDHIGEGAYEETEMKIRDLLKERNEVLGEKDIMDSPLAVSMITETNINSRSPETYFGSERNEFLANGLPGRSGEQTYKIPSSIELNKLYLGGTWIIDSENAKSKENSIVKYRYNAGDVYIVASSDLGAEIEVWQDGKVVTDASGSDVVNGIMKIGESRLYKIIKNPQPGEHTLELRVKNGEVLLYAFTFG